MSVFPFDRFIRVSDALIKFHAHFNAMKDEELDVYSLEIRSEELGKLWTKVQDCFEECVASLQGAGTTQTSDIESVDGKYDASHQAFMNCLSAINRKLGQFRRSRRSSITSSASSVVAASRRSIGSHKSTQGSEAILANNATTSIPADRDGQSLPNGKAGFRGEVAVSGPPLCDMVHNLALPPCDTDVFEGNFLDWPTFRDLFQAVYVNNSRLTDVERLCHLVRKTSGEAREIVSKFPLTHRSFALAWKALVDAYDNKRVLVHNQLKSLFAISAVSVETSAGLKSIQRGINGCLSALNTYEVSTDNWDQILVFICLQRLPRLTQTLWEQSVRDKSALSSWADLDAFLSERVRTLMCLHDLREDTSSKRSQEKKVKAHFTNASSSKSSRASSESKCVICPKHNHRLSACVKFGKLSVSERYIVVKRNRLCLNCLMKGHEMKDCPRQYSCAKCNSRHHSLLHRDSTPSNSATSATGSTNTLSSSAASFQPRTMPSVDQPQPSTSSACLPRQAFHTTQNRAVLLGTAMINIMHDGVSYPARALIDPASESSFLTERFRNRVKLPVHAANVTISGVNSAISAKSSKMCNLKIGSPLNASVLLETMAIVLQSISGNLPSFTVSQEVLSQIPDIRLADPNLFVSRPVDILLGADLYPRILLEGCRQIAAQSLIAQNSVFGWLVTGPISTSQIQTFTTTIAVDEEENLDRTLLRFWELEETPRKGVLSPSDKFCEENYVRTTRRDSEGRYIVTLPLKEELGPRGYLGESRTTALRQFYRNESSLSKRPDVKSVYDSVVKEYLHLDHMRPVSAISASDTLSCYLPHHPVINLEKKTSKLRVVFNASNKTSNGNSLNDILHVGPTLQQDLVLLIVRWRLFKYVFNCDITQMYRQIRVDSSHAPLQRIVFRDSPTRTVQDYELQTVTFGVNCAPYLAIRTLLQLAEDTEEEFPLAADILRKCMYVDDVLTGTHDLETAIMARDQLIAALATAKFELRKWTSNYREILDSLPPEYLVDAQLLAFVEASNSKPLGVRWNAQLDAFYFAVEPIAKRCGYTKREVLSAIAKLFDPVGWLGPVIIVAKIIMQKVWLDRVGWDEILPSATASEWEKFVDSYPDVNSINIPRWIRYTPCTSAELHVFSDASVKAYAGVVYIRVLAPNGEIVVNLLSCKTKVAPLKSVSLPRLELCGAVLASELARTVIREIGIDFGRIYCWTDSTIVLAWLKKTPSAWTTFVANRVCRIQENVGGTNWYHVRSEDNPADLGSRGVSPSDLAASRLWWHGPQWLSCSQSEWPVRDTSSFDTDVEIRSVKAHASFVNSYEDVLDRFSSLDRALRVISYVMRFFYRTHPAHRRDCSYADHSLSSSEIRATKSRLIVLAQKMNYGNEYKDLMDRSSLGTGSSLVSLNPFLDEMGVMRMYGRLSRSPILSYSERHPIILPYSCRFTKLLVEFVHLISIHGGNQLMLRILRIEYWIPRVRNLIRSVIHRCKPCLLERKRVCSQVMAPLPPERTVLDRPFTTTGVDYAGPFEVKSFTGRYCRITKGYVCVFVCFATRAIHLEAVSDLSTAGFLAAFHRFVARRGCPATIFSDNGTNFVGASRELERNFRDVMRGSSDVVSSKFAHQGLSWRFIPAGAPHMGGLWEAGVKSFKLHFRRQIGNVRFTFEEFSTVLARIEACLNSRPLCPQSDNPQELDALTPGHFLIGAPLLAPAEPVITEQPLSLVNRFRKVQALAQQFCVRWKEEYLKNLHMRYKWKFPQRDVMVNDLVVIRHEQLPPTSWKLGRVVSVHPGVDGHIRVQFCRLTVSSAYDPEQRLTFTARVHDLGRVLTPAEAVPERIKESFLGLPLADPQFYRVGRVAIVFGPEVYGRIITHRVYTSPGLPVAHYTIFGWVLSGLCNC
ncbi:uncharacterized protein LOC142224721 [Haematobia irritans]|uniref:uncharacterized protein LOC142224721 n=1 Tax=Haematobia irritans TaxID=7368 RepID=UPI003F50C43F